MAKTKDKILAIKESINNLWQQLGELSDEELEEVLNASELGADDLEKITGGGLLLSSNASLTCTKRGLTDPKGTQFSWSPITDD